MGKEQTLKITVKEIRRILNPERSQFLPIIIISDEKVKTTERKIVSEALEDLGKLTGENPRIYDLGQWQESDWQNSDGTLNPHKSYDWLMEEEVERQSFLTVSRSRVGVDQVLDKLFTDPYQLSLPHYDVVIIGRDLYANFNPLSFVIGEAREDLGTIISLFRFQRIKDENLRNHCLQTEVYHQFGHVLGLPNRKRQESLESSLGIHCVDSSCSMKQGLAVPDDWIKITFARLEKNQIYCPTCLSDLEKKFAK